MLEQNQGHLGPDSQWSTYESNVQAYRGLSMSVQSLYLAVGAILLGVGDNLPFFTVFALAMVTTWYVFFPVIYARCAIVDFYKFALESRFDANGAARENAGDTHLSPRAYADVLRGRALRARVASQIEMSTGERFRTMRQTRVKLDLVVPSSVTIVWIVFALYMVIAR